MTKIVKKYSFKTLCQKTGLLRREFSALRTRSTSYLILGLRSWTCYTITAVIQVSKRPTTPSLSSSTSLDFHLLLKNTSEAVSTAPRSSITPTAHTAYFNRILRRKDLRR